MTDNLTDRQRFMLASLAAVEDSSLAPVQVQKLFFLLDENLTGAIGKEKYFDFRPYDYGPFDKQVYQEFEILENMDMAQVGLNENYPGSRHYRLSREGQCQGDRELDSMEQSVKEYIQGLSQWVQKLTSR